MDLHNSSNNPPKDLYIKPTPYKHHHHPDLSLRLQSFLGLWAPESSSLRPDGHCRPRQYQTIVFTSCATETLIAVNRRNRTNIFAIIRIVVRMIRVDV